MDHHLSVEPAQAGLELDEFLCRAFPRVPKRHLRGLVRAGDVLVDGAPGRISQRLGQDQVVSVALGDEELPERKLPAAPDVDVLYEDDHCLVVDKPAALSVEPDRWDASQACLVGSLDALVERRDVPFRPRLIHRLDRDTSGAVLVAKTVDAERELRAAFDEDRVEKEYVAIVEGEYAPTEDGAYGLIDLPIGPDGRRSGRMAVTEAGGKEARTEVRVERRFRGYSLLECRPRTGRTHQIRVHLAEIGFPLAVDPMYGRRSALYLSEIKSGYRPKKGRPEPALLARLSLHARRLRFPRVGAPNELHVTVESPIPRDLERALKQLAKVRPPR